jgi:hypothetical protein
MYPYRVKTRGAPPFIHSQSKGLLQRIFHCCRSCQEEETGARLDCPRILIQPSALDPSWLAANHNPFLIPRRGKDLHVCCCCTVGCSVGTMSQTIAELLGLDRRSALHRDEEGLCQLCIHHQSLSDDVLEKFRVAATGPDGELYRGNVQPFSVQLHLEIDSPVAWSLLLLLEIDSPVAWIRRAYWSRWDALGRILLSLHDCEESTKCRSVQVRLCLRHTARPREQGMSEESLANLADSFCRWAQIPCDRMSMRFSNYNSDSFLTVPCQTVWKGIFRGLRLRKRPLKRFDIPVAFGSSRARDLFQKQVTHLEENLPFITKLDEIEMPWPDDTNIQDPGEGALLSNRLLQVVQANCSLVRWQNGWIERRARTPFFVYLIMERNRFFQDAKELLLPSTGSARIDQEESKQIPTRKTRGSVARAKMKSEADAHRCSLAIRGAKFCRCLSLMPAHVAPDAPTHLLTSAFYAVRAHVPHFLLQQSGKRAAANRVAVASSPMEDPSAGVPERAAKRPRTRAATARVE